MADNPLNNFYITSISFRPEAWPMALNTVVFYTSLDMSCRVTSLLAVVQAPSRSVLSSFYEVHSDSEEVPPYPAYFAAVRVNGQCAMFDKRPASVFLAAQEPPAAAAGCRLYRFLQSSKKRSPFSPSYGDTRRGIARSFYTILRSSFSLGNETFPLCGSLIGHSSFDK